MRYIREAALTGSILANDPTIPSLHAYSPERHYYGLPCEPGRLRPALLDARGGGEVHVLYLSDWSVRSPCSRQQHDDIQSALSREPLVELVAELADGKLYRLRASVYYADQFGNGVEAITKPSEPVQSDFPKVLLVPPGSEDRTDTAGASEADRIIRSRYALYLRGNRLIYENRNCAWEDEYGTHFLLTVYSLDSEGGTPERDTLDFEWYENSWKNNGTCVAERQLPDKDIVVIQTGQVDQHGNLLWEAEHWFEEKRRRLDGYLSSATSSEPVPHSAFDVHLGKGSLIFVKDPCGPEDTEPDFFVHLVPTDTDDLPCFRQPWGFDNLDFDFQWHGLREGGKCMAIRALPEYHIVGIRVGQYEGDSQLWKEEISLP